MKASKFSDARRLFSSKALMACRGGCLPQGGHQPGDLLQWKRRYNGLLPTEVQRLKQLEDEYARHVRLNLPSDWRQR
jgi:putative transposase